MLRSDKWLDHMGLASALCFCSNTAYNIQFTLISNWWNLECRWEVRWGANRFRDNIDLLLCWEERAKIENSLN